MCRGLSQRWLDNAVRRCRCRTRGRIQPTYWKAWPLAAFCDRQSKLEDSVRRQVATFANSRSSPTTEGFYDTRPQRNPKDVESPEIVPRDRRLNKERACAAVSIGSIRGGKIQCSNPVNAVKGKRPQRKNHVVRPVALDYV